MVGCLVIDCAYILNGIFLIVIHHPNLVCVVQDTFFSSFLCVRKTHMAIHIAITVFLPSTEDNYLAKVEKYFLAIAQIFMSPLCIMEYNH